jgi:hypothetical protein
LNWRASVAISKRRWLPRREGCVALIGDGAPAKLVARHLIAQNELVGYFSVKPDAAEQIPLPRLGTL